MASTGGGGSGGRGSSDLNTLDKAGKNKRKLVEHSPESPLSHPSPSTEFPLYESSSGKSENPPSDLMHSEAAAGSSQSDDWDDPLACQLEELLLSGIRTIYQNAIKLLGRRGYSEDVAQKAMSRLSFYHGGADIVENIVNDALALLNDGKGHSRDIMFEDLQQMVEFTMIELVNVLMQVKPSLSSGEAMWRLLICDIDISQACAMEEEISGESSSSSAQSSLTSQNSELPGYTDKPNAANSSLPHDSLKQETLKFGSFMNPPNTKSSPTQEKETVITVSDISEKSSSGQATSRPFSFEEKLKMGSKSLNKKQLASLQKSLNAERAIRTHGKSISQSGKISSLGNIILEKRLRSPSKSHSSGLKIKAKVESITVRGSFQVPGNGPVISAPTPETAEPVVSDKKASPKLEAGVKLVPKISDYYAGMPYDESSGQHIPQDAKDETILKLIPQVETLQNDVQGWTNWANQKVMQATRRLSKDKLELKSLKQEKQEAEKCEKDKKNLEENAMKRESEMKSALSKATSQFTAASSNIEKLEAQQSLLQKEMERQKLQAVASSVYCSEALNREKKAQKDVESIKEQRSLLEEELKSHKNQAAELQNQKCKAEKALNQIEGKWNREKHMREALIAQMASIRFEREKIEAAGKIQEDLLRQKAENETRKHMDEIEKLEKQLNQLRFKSNASRIADLKRGMDVKCKDTNQTVKGRQEDCSKHTGKAVAAKGLKRERECVMCLSEEKSVVFLPCAHQLLCVNCNELHEKKGMKDCLTCRTPIQMRVAARFVPN
ncbi:putative E3 ubiquitin-protein ligase RF298 [Mercurialis annua]|uniref:putative E3 ubiquitin-protein ligase RF298 n=1 Tax=Mercurialis annua TaxID=3986 RepID=UPI00215ECA87|nr:putative E3 ubiquitin-protein ligase RF298 [Mercurialis annua]